MNPKKWSIENRVYLEAETYEQAVSKFWDLMEKANIGSVFNEQPSPNCFRGIRGRNRRDEMTTPRIYVGTYAKYNNGSIQGEWLDLDDYTDKSDFIQACLELHDDEEDPELMFQDWENIPVALIPFTEAP